MKKIITTTFFMLCALLIHAQDINPFERIGKRGEVVTLSEGKYPEVHLNDSLQRVGSVIVNMNTGRIHRLLDADSLYASEEVIDPTLTTRWYSIDPKVKPNESPYASMSNNPIWFSDPDGQDTLVMHMTKVNSPDEQTILWKVSFTFIQDKVEYSMTSEKTVYFAMPQYYWEEPGNTQKSNSLIRIAFETSPSFLKHGPSWNADVIHLGGKGSKDGQYFHPAGNVTQSIGCFLACDYPVYKKNKFGGMEWATGKGDWGVKSKERLADVRTVHNEALKFNNDPKLDFFVKFGAASSSTTPYSPRETETVEPLKPLPVQEMPTTKPELQNN